MALRKPSRHIKPVIMWLHEQEDRPDIVAACKTLERLFDMEDTTGPVYLNTNDVADSLGVDCRTVRKMLETGALKGFRAGRSHYRTTPELLQEYIDSQKRRPRA